MLLRSPCAQDWALAAGQIPVSSLPLMPANLRPTAAHAQSQPAAIQPPHMRSPSLPPSVLTSPAGIARSRLLLKPISLKLLKASAFTPCPRLTLSYPLFTLLDKL